MLNSASYRHNHSRRLLYRRAPPVSSYFHLWPNLTSVLLSHLPLLSSSTLLFLPRTTTSLFLPFPSLLSHSVNLRPPNTSNCRLPAFARNLSILSTSEHTTALFSTPTAQLNLRCSPFDLHPPPSFISAATHPLTPLFHIHSPIPTSPVAFPPFLLSASILLLLSSSLPQSLDLSIISLTSPLNKLSATHHRFRPISVLHLLQASFSHSTTIVVPLHTAIPAALFYQTVFGKVGDYYDDVL